jgi:hypothetical protein
MFRYETDETIYVAALPLEGGDVKAISLSDSTSNRECSACPRASHSIWTCVRERRIVQKILQSHLNPVF